MQALAVYAALFLLAFHNIDLINNGDTTVYMRINISHIREKFFIDALA